MFVDTATLYPVSLADLVLRLAERGMFELLWSDHLLAEVERVLVEYKGLAAERAAYFCECIRQAFPEGRVAPEVYLPLVESRTGPDPDDHVHSAAAVAGAATVLLSADKKGTHRRTSRRHGCCMDSGWIPGPQSQATDRGQLAPGQGVGEGEGRLTTHSRGNRPPAETGAGKISAR